MRILCVCYGNTCRGPMMEAFLKCYVHRQDVVVESAGIVDKESTPATENAVNAMRHWGIDLSGHKSRPVKDLDMNEYDLFVCADPKTREALIQIGIQPEKIFVPNETQGGVANPWEKDLAVYYQCATMISLEMEELARQL